RGAGRGTGSRASGSRAHALSARGLSAAGLGLQQPMIESGLFSLGGYDLLLDRGSWRFRAVGASEVSQRGSTRRAREGRGAHTTLAEPRVWEQGIRGGAPRR